MELGRRSPSGITVNSVVPGPTTPGMFDKRPIEEQKAVSASSPLGRIGHAHDIADVVAFFVSNVNLFLKDEYANCRFTN